MADESAAAERRCPDCGAEVVSYQTSCWLCGATLAPPTDLAAKSPPTGAPQTSPPPRAEAPVSFSLSTMMLVTTLVAVCCGLLVAAPGLGISVCLLLAPVLVRTSMVLRRRERAGMPATTAEKVTLFLTSLVVAHVMLAVVLVAAVGTFCAVCLAAQTEAAIPFALLIGGGIGLVVVVLMVRWMRYRFRRDVDRGA